MGRLDHRAVLAAALAAMVLGAVVAATVFRAPDERLETTGDASGALVVEPDPAPPASLPLELYNLTLPFTDELQRGEGKMSILVREGDGPLVVLLDYPEALGDPAPVGPGAGRPTVRLIDPAESEVASCTVGDCEWTYASPAPGVWELVVPGRGEGEVRLLVTLVRVAEAPSEEVVHDASHMRDAADRDSTWEDSFLVEPGTTRIALSYGYSGRASLGVHRVDLVDPEGRTVAGTQGAEVGYEDPQPGRWRLVYTRGTMDGFFTTVTATR